MITLIKDLFYKNQFSRDDAPLDRDRYLLGVMLLVTVPLLLTLNAPLHSQQLWSGLGGGAIEAVVVSWAGLFGGIWLDPLFMIASLMLANRAFGKWWALPMGLLTFQATIGLSLMLRMFSFPSQPPSFLITGQGALMAVWALLQLPILWRKPALSRQNPGHPLLKHNPDCHKEQLSPIHYLWRCLQLGLASSLIIALLMAVAMTADYELADTAQMLARGATVIAYVLSFVLLMQRLRNLGWQPKFWLLKALPLFVAFSALQGLCYAYEYFGNPWLFLVVQWLTPLAMVAVAVFSLHLMLQPAAKALPKSARS
ncbi:hypothetical protein [Ferrimonas sp. SCSIO 43195]|uniref:hypothetical protein n=1 Tax=Ferrimonas sp. SCSIO 43195 TaxID=2822844 RepID=UPI002074F71D|nr:hypothetical protein [Ferrimonas sp. SCSIO 43195]USD38336.1 hypothetical protein J8Z22_04090 [Ferrimonas sp. SCSIO 43195]